MFTPRLRPSLLAIALLLLLWGFQTPARGDEPSTDFVEAAIANAKGLLGEPYMWGGRNTEGNPGVDCLGLLFLAYGPPTSTPWRRYPVDPSKIVSSRRLGDPVPDLDGVSRATLKSDLLQRGDVLYLLMAEYVIEDEPLWDHGETRYWPWHTALYLGDGQVIHADPGGVVREQALGEMSFDALFVTRLAGAQP